MVITTHNKWLKNNVQEPCLMCMKLLLKLNGAFVCVSLEIGTLASVNTACKLSHQSRTSRLIMHCGIPSLFPLFPAQSILLHWLMFKNSLK